MSGTLEPIAISEELKAHYNDLVEFKNSLFLETTLAKPSERVAAMNSITKLLSQLARDMEKVHNAENFAKTKQVLVNILKEVDEDISKEFLAKCRELKI